MERDFLTMRFGLKDGQPLLLTAVAIKLGIEREAARQMEVQLLRKLRKD